MTSDDHAAYINDQYASGAEKAKASTSKQQRMARVIADLLASAEVAAKRGDQMEVQRLIDQASALQLKFAVEDAMLPHDDPNRDSIEYMDFCRESNTPLVKAKRQLINEVSRYNRGKAILSGEFKKDADGNIRYRMVNGKLKAMYDSRAYVRVYAHKSDLEFIQALYTSLILQMQSFMSLDENKQELHVGRGKVTNAWRVSWAYGYVQRITQRLADAEHRNRQEATVDQPGTAVALVDRKNAVAKYVEDSYGKLKSASYRKDDKDAHGRNAGYEAGGKADLGGTKVGASKTRHIGQ